MALGGLPLPTLRPLKFSAATMQDRLLRRSMQKSGQVSYQSSDLAGTSPQPPSGRTDLMPAHLDPIEHLPSSRSRCISALELKLLDAAHLAPSLSISDEACSSHELASYLQMNLRFSCNGCISAFEQKPTGDVHRGGA